MGGEGSGYPAQMSDDNPLERIERKLRLIHQLLAGIICFGFALAGTYAISLQNWPTPWSWVAYVALWLFAMWVLQREEDRFG